MSIRNMMIGGAGASPPGAPTGVSAGSATASSLVVSFSAPANNGGSAITSFTVTSSPGGVTATGSSSPITVTGLNAVTSYTFTVTATNAIGTGSASDPSTAVSTLSADLYAFSSVTFGNGAATARTGPTAPQARAAIGSPAWADSYLNVTTQGIQEWTVPKSGTYSFTLAGAMGAYASGGLPYGAVINGSFVLTKSQVVKFLIGNMGGTGGDVNVGGGGGGSYVFANVNDSVPWVACGGGGGQGGSGTAGVASVLNLTTTGNGGGAGAGGTYGGGGTTNTESTGNGNGGISGSAGVAGRISNSGAGWTENGRQTNSDCGAALNCAGTPGFAPRNGGVGGQSFSGTIACSGTGGGSAYYGGFGGGGGSGYAAGAGGGGYSGGGGGDGCSNKGGGGGSYYNSSIVTFQSSTVNNGTHGFFAVSFVA
jgi:hypothetical protein